MKTQILSTEVDKEKIVAFDHSASYSRSVEPMARKGFKRAWIDNFSDNSIEWGYDMISEKGFVPEWNSYTRTYIFSPNN